MTGKIKKLMGIKYKYTKKIKFNFMRLKIKKNTKNTTGIFSFRITGGLGDLIVAARFIRDLLSLAPSVKFDIYYGNPPIAKWIFKRFHNLRGVYLDNIFFSVHEYYDVSMEVNHIPIVLECGMDLSYISQFPEMVSAIKSIIHARKDLQLCIDNYPQLDHLVGRKAIFSNADRRNYLSKLAGIKFIDETLCIDTEKYEINSINSLQKYIVIHNGYDPNFNALIKNPTKQYLYFDRVVEILKERVPNIPIVQIGISKTSIPLKGTINLLDKTTMKQAADIIKNSCLLIDNESGLVHLAAALGKKAAVVFGPTPKEYFGYPKNISISPEVCGGCWWVTSTWMEKCPKNQEKPECFASISAERIANTILMEMDYFL